MASNPNRDKRHWGDIESLGGMQGSDNSQIHNVGQRITDIRTGRKGHKQFTDSQGNSWREKKKGSGEFFMTSGQGGGSDGGGMGYQAPIKIRFGSFDDKKTEAARTGGGQPSPGPGAVRPNDPVTGVPTSNIVGQGPLTMANFSPVSIDPATGQPQHLNPLVDTNNWMHQTNPNFQVVQDPGTYVAPGILDYLQQITSGSES